ncbi:MAG: methionyl-tRNA formyltransferase, partial [Actinobacteria bacterium]|nr:methionyl-tRNA formyltransferase [Actinomycetota bacterium]
TTFRLVQELDAGPVFGVLTEAIRPTDTAGDLLDRLAAAGADLMVATLDGIESGELEARPQPGNGVSLAPKVTPADAKIDWAVPALAVGRRIRACTPEPGAWTELAGARVKLWPVLTPGTDAGSLAPGELQQLRDRVFVGTATEPVELGDVQQHGRRRMPAVDWARGLRLPAGRAILG